MSFYLKDKRCIYLFFRTGNLYVLEHTSNPPITDNPLPNAVIVQKSGSLGQFLGDAYFTNVYAFNVGTPNTHTFL